MACGQGTPTRLWNWSNRLLKNSFRYHPEVALDFGTRGICFTFNAHKKQILRYSTPATAKTAVAGDPGFHPNEPSLVGDPGYDRMTPSENSFSATVRATTRRLAIMRQ
jgi:hypothetical protein